MGTLVVRGFLESNLKTRITASNTKSLPTSAMRGDTASQPGVCKDFLVKQLLPQVPSRQGLFDMSSGLVVLQATHASTSTIYGDRWCPWHYGAKLFKGPLTNLGRRAKESTEETGFLPAPPKRLAQAIQSQDRIGMAMRQEDRLDGEKEHVGCCSTP